MPNMKNLAEILIDTLGYAVTKEVLAKGDLVTRPNNEKVVSYAVADGAYVYFLRGSDYLMPKALFGDMPAPGVASNQEQIQKAIAISGIQMLYFRMSGKSFKAMDTLISVGASSFVNKLVDDMLPNSFRA